jgi:uncharacterized membrane protein
MSNQPPYDYPPGGGYPPPGGYPPGGSGYQGGGYPPPPGGPEGKTQVLGLSYNIAGMLCYLPTCLCCINLISSILWLVTEPKQNRFVRFHAMQGLLLFGVGFLIGIIFNILGVGAQFGARVGTGSDAAGAGAGMLITLVSWAISAVLFILHIVAAIKASQGQMWKLPVIGDIAEKNS